MREFSDGFVRGWCYGIAVTLLIYLTLSLVGCRQHFVECGTTPRNLTIPYAYAAAYVISLDEPDSLRSESTEKSTDESTEKPSGIASGKTSVIETPLPDMRVALPWQLFPSNSAAASDGTPDASPKVIAPPAAPLIYVYGYNGCSACKWAAGKLKAAGANYQYIILGNSEIVPGQEYPWAKIDGRKVEYDELKTYLTYLENTK